MVSALAELLKTTRRMVELDLVRGTSGNISIRQETTLYITPSGLPYDKMDESSISVIDLRTGEQTGGTHRPSSEVFLHTKIYQTRTDVSAIVHTHSLYATMFAVCRRPIRAIHYIIAQIGNEIPVAEYATYGTQTLAENVVHALGQNFGVLMANHGVVCVGDTLARALERAVTVEYCAELSWGAQQLGSPVVLDSQEMQRVSTKFQTYGPQKF